METKKTTKSAEVLKHLKSGKSITSLEAINLYGATRLSAIIHRLRKRGFDIVSVSERKLDRYGKVCTFSRYRLCTKVDSYRISNDESKSIIVNEPKLVKAESDTKKDVEPKSNKPKGFFARLFNL